MDLLKIRFLIYNRYPFQQPSIIKNNLCYMDGIAQDDGLSSLYTELSELRNEIEQFDSENLNNDEREIFEKKIDRW